MGEQGTCCAHLRVSYAPVSHLTSRDFKERWTLTERWVCDDCGTEFASVARFQALADTLPPNWCAAGHDPLRYGDPKSAHGFTACPVCTHAAVAAEFVGRVAALRDWHKRYGCIVRRSPIKPSGNLDVTFVRNHDDANWECDICSILDCPSYCEDHYHHDGCPVCVQPVNAELDAIAARKLENERGSCEVCGCGLDEKGACPESDDHEPSEPFVPPATY